MKLEHMAGALAGWRLLIWKQKAKHPELTWKKEWYKLALRLFKDTNGLQFSATWGNK